MAMVDYAALTLLAQAAFPQVRRSDLMKAVIVFAAALEGLRALTVWHGDATVLLESLAAIAAAHIVSFMEQFRSGVRQEAGSTFTLSHSKNRRVSRPRLSQTGPRKAKSPPPSLSEAAAS